MFDAYSSGAVSRLDFEKDWFYAFLDIMSDIMYV